MAEIKIILLCSGRLALPALQELSFFQLVAVVVVPRHCEEMLETVQHGLAGTGIPVLEVDKLTYVEQLKAAIETYRVNLGLMITFSYKIPASVYKLPKHGFFNVHPGPLPAYRGSDPVFMQIRNREKQAGVTIHLVDDGFDTGPVVSREMIKLLPTDTYGILTTKLAVVAARLITVLVKLIDMDLAVPSKTQDAAMAVYHKRQRAKDVSIDWQRMEAETIIALINACNPWNKGATTKLNGRIIRILHATKLPEPIAQPLPPGTLVSIGNDGLVVSTVGNQCLLLHIVYLEEGFMQANRLAELGTAPGHVFETT